MKQKLSTLLISSALASSAFAGSDDLMLGDHSLAMGGAIATGTNTVAIGKGALASGDNMTADEIKRRLAENQEKLNEITQQNNTVNGLTQEIKNLNVRYHDTIEAGVRVEEVRKAKANAKKEYDRLQQIYDTEKANSAEFFRQAQAKIDDFNSRLNGVSNIKGYDINDDGSLTRMAEAFKTQVEDGTTLDLNTDFYKNYIQSYYQALGDLRSNWIEYNRMDYDNTTNINNLYYLTDYNTYRGQRRYFGLSIKGNGLTFWTDFTYHRNAFNGFDYITNKPKADLDGININTQVLTQEEWNKYQENVPLFKQAMAQLVAHNDDPLLGDEGRQAILNIFDKKLDYRLKAAEIAYYQGEYERTHNLTFLDKKKVALQEFEILRNEIGILKNPNIIKEKNINQWKQTHITDITERNKITTEKLTNELEQALGINRQAVEQKQAELAKMLANANQAKTNWQNINPTARDLILSAEYEKVKQALAEKNTALNNATERLKWLKEHLTLNTFEQGENATAVGTANLVTGANATAVGVANIVANTSSVAIGDSNTVTGTESTAIGQRNNVAGNNNIAIGSDITIADGISNAVVIGKGSTVAALVPTVSYTVEETTMQFAGTPVGVFSVGATGKERVITNVAAGRISDTSTDAINGSQLAGVFSYVNGKLTSTLNTAKAYTDNQVAGLSNGTDTTTLNAKAAETLNQAKTYTDNKMVEAVNTANAHSDANDVKTLKAANDYTDKKAKATLEKTVENDEKVLGEAKYYTDVQIVKLKQNLADLVPTSAIDQRKLDKLESRMKNYANSLHKEAIAGVAGAYAVSAIAHVPGAKFSVGAGVGVYSTEKALAIGVINTSDNGRYQVRFAASYDTQGNAGGQAGISIGF